jgi:glycosyltransferase involved in cell wall biosynthesis
MGRPAALYLTPRLPWPIDDGGRVVAWQNLVALAGDHDTTLVSFAPSRVPVDVPRELADLGVRVVQVHFAPPPTWLSAAMGLLGRWPYSLARYRSGAFETAIRAEIARRRPAFVYVQNLHLATYVDALDGVPMVLREQNVEFLWMTRYARSQGATARGAYARLQALRLRHSEADLCARAALVLAIQDEEARAIRAIAPGARVETLPIGVDLASIPPRAPAHPPIVLLAASFEWPPNVDGAIRFLRDGWPRLHETSPDVRMRVAGKSPPPSLAEAARTAGAELAADVPSMSEEFARAEVLVVPLWVGAGARVKIVQALAARLPVVSTDLGAAGLGLEPGKQFLAADTPEIMADAVAMLLRDSARREALATAGRAEAEGRWSLDAVAALQARFLSTVHGDNRMVAPPHGRR